ncbi:MAG: DUF4340 domain-containing protein [Terriglobales bacterium]
MKSWWRLIAAVVVLIVIVVVLNVHHKTPTVVSKPLVTLTESQVNRIAIQQPGQPEVVLTKLGANWTLDQPYHFAAESSSVSSLLDSLSDITGAQKVATVTPSVKLAAFGLDTSVKSGGPSTVSLGLTTGKTITFEFGSDTPTGGNTYLRLGGAGPVEMASDYVKTNALQSAFAMQDKTALHFPSGQITAITIAQHGKTLHFAKSKNAWPKAQVSSINSLLDSLSDAQMDSMVAPTAAAAAHQAAAAGLAHPNASVTLTWLGGKATLDIGAKTGAAEYFARNSSGPAIFKISDYLITDVNNLTTPAPAPSVVKAGK